MRKPPRTGRKESRSGEKGKAPRKSSRGDAPRRSSSWDSYDSAQGGERKKERPDGDRPSRGRGERSFDKGERPARGRSFDKEDRTTRSRSFDKEDRPGRGRSFDKEERPARGRSFDKEERPARGRSFDKEERPARGRSFDKEERPSRGRSFDKEERPARGRSFDKEERPSRDRSFDKEGRPSRGRSFDKEERPSRSRSFDKEERPSRGRSFDKEDRPSRGRSFDKEERPSRGRSFDKEERPSRGRSFDKEERPARGRSFDKEERPSRGRSFDKEERPSRGRSFDKEERPSRVRSFDKEERPSRGRSFDKEERPSRGRSFDKEERPSRERAERSFDREERPEGNRSATRSRGSRPSAEDRHEQFERKYATRYREESGGKKKRQRSSGDALPGEIRLNRYISMAGICSRREADELIEAGVISVNGKVVTELGSKVSPGDDIRYNGERIRNEKNVYVLLNKPKDYITTSDDPDGRKTVMELIEGACKERVYPVGRLDRNTTGLLLFTNDGDLAKHLTHPSSRVSKIYHVELDKNVKVADMKKLREGVELEDGIASVDEVEYDGEMGEKKSVGVRLHSGKNRIVRRIFETLGYEVRKLDRVGFAGLTKKDLPRGRWRLLDEKEVGFLKMQGGKKSKPE